MHIPDGFLSPQTYIASFAVAVPLLIYSFRKTKERLDDESLPFISTLSAFCFVLMMFNIPIPGGTSGHAFGTAILSVLYGPWVAALGVSVVLLIQSLLFADGGITAFGVNSLGMGFAAAFAAHYSYGLLGKRVNDKAALFAAGWLGSVAASVVIAFALGIQPIISHDGSGKPLYFPFDLGVTMAAIVGSHTLVFGVLEGAVTAAVVIFVRKIKEGSAVDAKRV